MHDKIERRERFVPGVTAVEIRSRAPNDTGSRAVLKPAAVAAMLRAAVPRTKQTAEAPSEPPEPRAARVGRGEDADRGYAGEA